jgi:hypothetical protein
MCRTAVISRKLIFGEKPKLRISDNPNPDDGPREPPPPSPQIEPHEPDQRHDDHPGRRMHPAHRQAELFGRFRPH